jgi:hypothetical protein
VVMVSVLLGCATDPQAAPDDCSNSLIHKVAAEMHTTPQVVGTIFQLANLELLKHNVVAKDDVAKFLDDAESLLGRENTTYLDLVTLITLRVRSIQEKFEPELILLITAFSEQLSKPIPIDSCDKKLLLKHIADQRKVQEMV